MSKKEKLKQKKAFREYISIADKRVLNTQMSGIELIADDEVFVLVNNTHNFWISNHGRLVNNLRGYYYMHKGGNAHYTLSAYDSEGKLCPTDTYCEKLVAEHFLENLGEYNTVWHIDGNKDNCYYKNLLWVNDKEYLDLKRERLSVYELGRQQEYVPYITLKNNVAYQIWNGIYMRCYRTSECNAGACYEPSTMHDQWLNDKEMFAEWYNANYYECDGESMVVDKDLLFPGNKEYAPDKCCILPQTINIMLSNCKKHYNPKCRTASDLPLGVRYSTRIKMYYGEITPYGHDEVIRLSYWDTPEEAFAEYKKIKQADILIMAAKYKNKVPKHIYDALLKVDVKPY